MTSCDTSLWLCHVTVIVSLLDNEVVTYHLTHQLQPPPIDQNESPIHTLPLTYLADQPLPSQMTSRCSIVFYSIPQSKQQGLLRFKVFCFLLIGHSTHDAFQVQDEKNKRNVVDTFIVNLTRKTLWDCLLLGSQKLKEVCGKTNCTRHKHLALPDDVTHCSMYVILSIVNSNIHINPFQMCIKVTVNHL